MNTDFVDGVVTGVLCLASLQVLVVLWVWAEVVVFAKRLEGK